VNTLQLFLPCAAGVEEFLAHEAHHITGLAGHDLMTGRGGLVLQGSWRDALQLNLHSRLAQRVLVQLAHTGCRTEDDVYAAASAVAWELWFTPRQSFKIEVTAQHSPLKSLNFAALKVKDAVADRFRAKQGVRPSVETTWPEVRIYVHFTREHLTLYIDTTGEPLFKRGWRTDKGDAPLKETLAAAMIAASGWDAQTPLYDPCCGSGTIAIEAAQIACGIAPGSQRRFAFEKLLPFQSHVWQGLLGEARARIHAPTAPVFGSDVAHRMVDFAERNAQRAGVAHAVQLRGGDALQRMPPSDAAGVMLLNPPYGERIATAGVAGRGREGFVSGHLSAQRSGRDAMPAHGSTPSGDDGSDFFMRLSAHWKQHFSGWSAWMLTPDMKLPSKMRFKESRRVPMWNGPIECRLFRFDLIAGSARRPAAVPPDRP
jgi:putative N6-adenine-specific DNA methylase